MERIRQLLNRLFTTFLLFMLFVSGAEAALLDVGPVVPEVLNSSPPQHGYPLWYRDTNRIPLDLCLSGATSPNVPGALMCSILPGATYDPALPMAFPVNFPDEVFWWTGDARIRGQGPVGRTQVDLIMAIEGAWGTGAIVSGKQITFARIRILGDVAVTGDYTIIHPYGQKTFFNVPAGAGVINYTEDIGIVEGKFDGALQGRIGPFLVWDSGAPINVNGELFIGDPNVNHTVTGSPFGTNILRIVGPPGSNLDGLGNNFLETNLFAVSGKIHQQVIPTPLKVDRATYARDTTGSQVNVFATTQVRANVTNPATPFPGNFALLGTLSSLQVSGAGIPTTTMATRAQADGRFFSTSGIFPNPATLPATITVTNTADVPPTPLDVPLVDDVTVSLAAYRPLTKTLTIAAASSDKVNPPVLQAYMPGMSAPLGTLSAGQLSVTFPITDNSVNPPKTYQIPPATVTVRSAIGGEVTVPVMASDVQ